MVKAILCDYFPRFSVAFLDFAGLVDGNVQNISQREGITQT
jgi:hypothetical protein